jgi:hypothetical protein
MTIGATMEDADDTISDVIVDMLKKDTWGRLTTNPRAWVRKAVLHIYYDQQKRQRQQFRREIQRQLAVAPGSHVDDGPNVWEDWQWVEQMLSNWAERMTSRRSSGPGRTPRTGSGGCSRMPAPDGCSSLTRPTIPGCWLPGTLRPGFRI